MKTGIMTALALLLAATGLHAQSYPSKAITIVVPNPPGGMNQIHAQPLSAVLEKLTPQPAPIVNRPGGVSAIGTAFVANQPADGHAILVTTANLHLVIEKDKLYGIKPHPALPDVPTFQSMGYKNVEAYLWVGLFTAKGVPGPVLNQMRQLIAKAAADPSFKQTLEKVRVVPDYRDGDAFKKFFDADYQRMAAIIKKVGKI